MIGPRVGNTEHRAGQFKPILHFFIICIQADQYHNPKSIDNICIYWDIKQAYFHLLLWSSDLTTLSVPKQVVNKYEMNKKKQGVDGSISWSSLFTTSSFRD